MSTEQLANNAATTLSGNGGSITAIATSLKVANASQFPAVGNFRILIGSELMLVTAVAGSTFTVTRQIESTLGAIHNDGDAVTHILTAGGLIQAITDRLVLPTEVLLEEHAGSIGLASIDFITRNKNGYTGNSFQSDFDNYIFKFKGVIPGTTGANFLMRLGAASFDAGANYGYLFWFDGFGDSFQAGASMTGTEIHIAHSVSITANWSLNGRTELMDPLGAGFKQLFGKVTSPALNNIYMWDHAGAWKATTPAQRAQFLFSGGSTIPIGTIRLYGVRA